MIEIFSKEYRCTEIEDYDDLNKVKAQTIIIMSPELLIGTVALKKIKRRIKLLHVNVVIVTNENIERQLWRRNISFLKALSVQIVFEHLRTIAPNKCKTCVFVKVKQGFRVVVG